MSFRTILKQNRSFLLPYSLMLMACIVWLCTESKVDIHLAINQWHSPLFDTVFKYLTDMGNFIFIAPICLGLFFVSYRYGVIASVTTILAPLGTQFCKRIVWPDSPRPKVVFDQLYDLHVVEGVRLHSSHSFPSGHTTGAFAIFCCLALFAKKPFWKVCFLLLAVLTGYSRMYLSQHFLIDVTVGSFIGTFTAVMVYWWMSHYQPSWMESSLCQTIGRRKQSH